jgi:hypothetical protein
MQSPRAEWVLGIGYLAVIDILRDIGDPDGDTLSEVTRDAFGTDEPGGRVRLAAVLAAGGVLLYRHLTKPATR